MKNKPIFSILVSLILSVFAGSELLKRFYKNPKAQGDQTELPQLGSIADFILKNQDDTPYSLKDLQGKVSIADFFFTRCMGPCPKMSVAMKQVQDGLLSSPPNVRLISISMDPSYDQPAVLKKYAEKYEAIPARWSFLTGDKQEVVRLATQTFKLAAGEEPDLHSTRFVLIDQEAQIRGYYDSLDKTSIQKLLQDALALSRQETNPNG
ncbi:MAG: SCO family protein [Oligoflexales bacterium]|nr:SCO family protein [Oligoflexales bacterium]